MNIIKIEEKVYTEPCNHIYCISCLCKLCMGNNICPMDRLKLKSVHVCNPIETVLKIVKIKPVMDKNICREKQNVS